MASVMGHRSSITAHRNRAIYSAYLSGVKLEEISRIHALTKNTARAIIHQERHKMEVGLDDYYRQQRRASEQVDQNE